MQSLAKYLPLVLALLVVLGLASGLALRVVTGMAEEETPLWYSVCVFLLIVVGGSVPVVLCFKKLAGYRLDSQETPTGEAGVAVPGPWHPVAMFSLGIVATACGVILTGLAFTAIFLIGFIPFNFAALLLLIVFYCWAMATYLQYRHGRQAEFQQLLATAAEAGAPLAPALRAYLRDRPGGTAREAWIAVLLFFVLPGYYWIWHRRHNYDRKIAQVIDRLEMGHSLHDALRAVPGVVSAELLLAVKIGQATGQLARCLRTSATGRLGTVWIEVLPGLLYPIGLLVFVSLVVGFWSVFLLPKMEKIYHDFNEPLPGVTRKVAGLTYALVNYGWLFILGILGLLQMGYMLQWSSKFRWHIPGLNRFFRMNAQSRVMRMLGILLETGKPVPESLQLLVASEAFGSEEKKRIEAARYDVERGEPMAQSLQKEGLLQPAMVPLVQAAERAHHLPWALAELGETLLSRLIRLMRRTSMLLFPVSVLALGALVGFLVLGMFMPLVQLLTRLSQW